MMRINLLLKCIITTIIVSGTIIPAGNAQGIQFEESTFNEALAKAGQQKKLLFIDCYTTWCGPCKMLSKMVFPNDTAGAFFNKHFINLKMDMEKGEGKTLSKTFRITGYPTLLFINPENQEIVYRVCGAHPNVQWLVGEAQKAVDPNQNLPGLSARYTENKQDAPTVLRYLNGLGAASMMHERDSVLHLYLSSLSDENRYSEDNWQIIESQVNEPYSTGFEYLLKYAPGYRQSIGEEKVNEKIETVYKYAVSRFIRRKRIPAEQFPQPMFDRLVSLLKEYNGKNASFYRAELNLVDLVQKGDYKGVMDALDGTEKDPAFSDDKRFYFTWVNLNYLSECKDPVIINRGLAWAEKLKPYLSTPAMKRSWLLMKSALYAAKGDSETEKALKEEAEKMK
ncbi:thioredoxin family protein [Bacteroides congonensis]|uniref:thioredoxin family protein n=1 Tax=Bacteroides TaxID=816 RepID=UPI001897208D|nr:thioredoxin family protein [Bacteroides congonensis]